ncbi:MAG: hypothetical protein HQ568_02505 [Calditrichaeota bacterium]|nr:hypothetical protein [Calditrichota bacterium]
MKIKQLKDNSILTLIDLDQQYEYHNGRLSITTDEVKPKSVIKVFHEFMDRDIDTLSWFNREFTREKLRYVGLVGKNHTIILQRPDKKYWEEYDYNFPLFQLAKDAKYKTFTVSVARNIKAENNGWFLHPGAFYYEPFIENVSYTCTQSKLYGALLNRNKIYPEKYIPNHGLITFKRK